MSFSHVSSQGRPKMVDVSDKATSLRFARAQAVVNLGLTLMAKLQQGELTGPKGPVFATAIIAGTMATKKTHELIPFCHPILIDGIEISIHEKDEERIVIECEVRCRGNTGVEMEALTGVHIAALTIHDMCKAVDPSISVEFIGLIEKTGGKKNFKRDTI